MSGGLTTFPGNAASATVISIQSANAGLLVSPASGTGAVTLTLGELTYGTLGGIGISFTGLAAGAIIYDSGSGWTNLPVGTSGQVLTISGGLPTWATPTSAVTSVSNSDGTLTISPTTGAVVASLALGHANSWTATQTFGNHISIGGCTFDITSPAAGDLWYYNGTNVVNLAIGSTGQVLAVSGGAPAWSSGPFPAITQIQGSNFSGTVTTSAQYYSPGDNVVRTTTNWAVPLVRAGTLKNFYVYVTTNSLSSSDHYTITVNVYASPGGSLVSQALTVTVTGGATGQFTDTTDSITVSAGEYMNIEAISNAGSGSLGFVYAVEYDT